MLKIDDCELNNGFKFKYSRFNIYSWNIPEQRESLLESLKKWVKERDFFTPEDYLNAELEELFQKILKKDKKIGDLDLFKDEYVKYGFRNKAGELVLPCKWKDAFPFTNGLARVKDAKENWGYINLKGDVVIRCQWYHAWGFKDGLARVKTSNNKYWYIDKSGHIIGPAKYNS